MSYWYDSFVSSNGKRGKFLTFEGLDGCGKSTQMELLAEVLRRDGLDVITTREPGGTPTGEKIRSVILDSKTRSLAPMAELTLMFAARAQHIAEVVRPALEAGRFVLCDRFTDSSEAYQGGGRQMGSELILTMHQVVCGDLMPDMTVLMDSDPEASVARARRRNKANASGGLDENRFERESREFFERVHAAYNVIAVREAARVVKVDARRSKEVVHPEIVRAVRERMGG
jgi:dTMP kinase